MSAVALEALVAALSGISGEDKPSGLLDVLRGDLEAKSQSWPPAIVTADRRLMERLHTSLPVAVLLPPFEEVTEWRDEDVRSLERSGVVVAGTHARQLLPGLLVDALRAAAAAGAPILLVVDSMGRTRDPLAARAGFVRQLAAVLPNVKVAVCCLGDARFEGPSPADAAAQATGLRSEAQRTAALAVLRATDASTVLAARAADARASLRAASEIAGLLRASEHGGTILATADVGGWKQHLRGLRGSLSSIDIADVILTARKEASGAAVVRQAIAELRTRIDSGLKSAAKEAESLILSDFDGLATAISRDLARARDAVVSAGAKEAEAKLDVAQQRSAIGAGLAEIVARVVGGIAMPDQLLALAEALSDVRSSAQPPTTPPPGAAAPPGGESDASEPQPDQSSPATGGETLSSRLLRILANAPERLIAARLQPALEETLSEAGARCDHGVGAACEAWIAHFVDTIEHAYAPLHAASETARSAAGTRLDVVIRALDAVERVHGGR